MQGSLGPYAHVPDLLAGGLIAVDAYPFHRSHAVTPEEVHTFFGHLAVTLSIEDPKSFRAGYERILDETCASVFVPRLKRVYKAFDVNKS
jgi:hypothetical protein